jgi:hypothetical protein
MMFGVAHTTLVATHGAHAATVAHAAVPIIPILLLPFILVFFVVVFPLWMLSLAVLGLVLLALRGAAALSHRGEQRPFDGAAAAVHRLFRWVLTFGGFTERGKTPAE